MKGVLNIKALDTLFFRDGRPYTMGDNSWAQQTFPPTPTTLYGMLRSLYLEQNMDQLAHINGPNDPTAPLIIGGIQLRMRKGDSDITLYPAPRDYVQEKNSDKSHSLQLKKNDIALSSNKLPYKLGYQGDAKIQDLKDNSYISSDQLTSYLEGHEVDHSICIDDYLLEELKVGIGRDLSTGRAKDGHLYRISTSRLESFQDTNRAESVKEELKTIDTSNINNSSLVSPQKNHTLLSLLVHYEGITLPNKMTHRLGGESKLASSTHVNIDELSQPNFKTDLTQSENSMCRLYLATPGIFADGWYPKALLGDDLMLEAAATGKPMHIGGWDIALNRPKPMVKAVPSGSVYYISGSTEKLQNLIEKNNGKALYHDRPKRWEYQYAKEGYGIAHFGIVKKRN